MIVISGSERIGSSKIDHWLWEHPEWWTYLLSVLSWLIIIVGGHNLHHMSPAFDWALMIIAMMLPNQVAQIRRVAFRSFRTKRHLSIFFFTLGYLLVWFAIGALIVVNDGVKIFADYTASALFVISAIWMQTKMCTIYIWKCHGTRPLHASGFKWTASVFHEGTRMGLFCFITCGPAMIACALSNHEIYVMAIGMIAAYLLRAKHKPPLKSIGALNIISALLVFPF